MKPWMVIVALIIVVAIIFAAWKMREGDPFQPKREGDAFRGPAEE